MQKRELISTNKNIVDTLVIKDLDVIWNKSIAPGKKCSGVY